MSHEEIMQRMIASTGLSWDANIESMATLDDIDFNRVNLFIQKVKEKGRFPIPNHVSEQEVLRKLELIRDHQHELFYCFLVKIPALFFLRHF